MHSNNLKVLPKARFHSEPILNLDWQKIAGHFGSTVCLTLENADFQMLKHEFESELMESCFPVRKPYFSTVAEFAKILNSQNLVVKKNIQFLKSLENLLVRISTPINKNAPSGFAFYVAAANTETPLHFHVLDRIYKSEPQIAFWFTFDKSVVPQFEFVFDNKNEPWPDLSGSNCYIINTKIPHRGDSVSANVLYFFSFCRKIDVAELLKVIHTGAI